VALSNDERALFARLMMAAPFQPATNLWRAIEIGVLQPAHFPEGRGLDLGCGDGRLARIVFDRVGSRRLVGLDPDPLETSAAVASGVYERVHTAPGDHIPEPDAAFQFVFSNSVLEHIPSLEPVLGEVARVLAPGGRFVFTVPADGFHAALSGPWWPGVSRQRYLDTIDRRCAHVRYWSAAEWRQALGAHGMNVVHTQEYLAGSQLRRWENLSRLTAGVLFVLSGQRRHPIAIQRALGLRGPRLPESLARAAARFLALGTAASEGRGTCLLVIAEKPR
jgi:SAM-dependent methyltransferase